jgi:hypothetical protein
MINHLYVCHRQVVHARHMVLIRERCVFVPFSAIRRLFPWKGNIPYVFKELLKKFYEKKAICKNCKTQPAVIGKKC